VTIIEVFAELGCPFTHAGLRRLVERREADGRDDLVLRVRAWPLELVNGTPLDPALIDEEVAELREQVAPDLFAGFDPARFPASSLPGLDLAAAAYGQGAEQGERASLLLRNAIFEQGRAVGDADVLEEIAAAVGVPVPGDEARAQVLADWHEGQARGVIGSPHFFVGDDSWFCPSLDIQRVDGHLLIRSDPAAFATFIDHCLSA
jgi:predicted DsbA family dithiol-disulfide isomerase